MMTKLLFISLLPPVSKPKNGGEQTFSFYFNRFMNDDSFQVKLISCARYSDRDYYYEELRDIDAKLVLWRDPSEFKLKKIIDIESKFNPFNRNANLISNTTEKEIIHYIDEFMHEGYIPDVIILEWTEMVVLSKIIKSKYPDIYLVASEHDVSFIGYERKKNYFKGFKSIQWAVKYAHEKQVEIKALLHCDLVLPHNSEHCKILIENGIDRDLIHSLVPCYQNMNTVKRNASGEDILFLGALSRLENTVSVEWFIKNVMPLLTDIDCKLIVVGNNPNKELIQYEGERVHITGYVENIVPYFESARCFIAPLLIGAGIKIKVLEALSSGLPVLTNQIGIEGIPAKPGRDYIHCETAEEYSSAIHDLFSNKINGRMIGNQGKSCILESFSPDKFYCKYAAMLSSQNKMRKLL